MKNKDPASHYNSRPNISRIDRTQSPILSLKSFNNWIKSLLIQKFTCKGASVFDMASYKLIQACGKGGDLNKWAKQEIRILFACDIATVSITHAQSRYDYGRFRFNARFETLDCYSKSISPLLNDPNYTFDVCSVQFALHYSFESEIKARMALKNATSHLKRGGFFIGTIPNAYRIIKNIGKTKNIGNSIFSIEFTQTEEKFEFGHEYSFRLQDAIDGCPEFVICMQVLRRLAKEFDLELVYHKGFHEIYVEEQANPESIALFHRMQVLNDQNTISDPEWEAIGLYSAFAFQKK